MNALCTIGAPYNIGADVVHADGRGPSPLNSVFYGLYEEPNSLAII